MLAVRERTVRGPHGRAPEVTAADQESKALRPLRIV